MQLVHVKTRTLHQGRRGLHHQEEGHAGNRSVAAPSFENQKQRNGWMLENKELELRTIMCSS